MLSGNVVAWVGSPLEANWFRRASERNLVRSVHTLQLDGSRSRANDNSVSAVPASMGCGKTSRATCRNIWDFSARTLATSVSTGQPGFHRLGIEMIMHGWETRTANKNSTTTASVDLFKLLAKLTWPFGMASLVRQLADGRSKPQPTWFPSTYSIWTSRYFKGKSCRFGVV